MSHVFARSRRKTLISTVVTALAASLLAVVPTTAATAATLPVSGVVSIDASADHQVTTGEAIGRNDGPAAGVTVTLVCTDPQMANPVVKTTTTAADGSYGFAAADAATCRDNEVRVHIDTSTLSSKQFLTQTAAGFTATARDTARSDPFQLTSATTQVLDALIAPSWVATVPSLRITTGSYQGAITGSNPLDSLDPATDNAIVRASDTTQYSWTVTMNEAVSGSTSKPALTFEQTVTMADGAIVNFDKYPTECSAGRAITALPGNTTIQPGATPPAGTTAVVLTCRLAAFDSTTQLINVPTTVRAMSTSKNGGTFSTTSRVYATDTNGVAVVRPSADSAVHGPITVVTEPTWNIEKKLIGQTVGSMPVVPGGPRLPGFSLYYNILVSADTRYGSEPFGGRATFTDSFWGIPKGQNSELAGLEWYVAGCAPMPAGFQGYVAGRNTGGATSAQSVSDSGSCTPVRTQQDNTSPYTFTLANIDDSLEHVPTVTDTAPHVSLAQGPFYVASYRVQVFVPSSEVDRADGILGNVAGELSFQNLVADFAPEGLTGTTNFGSTTGEEPGYCSTSGATVTGLAALATCDDINGNRSDNVADAKPVALLFNGAWGKQLGKQHVAWTWGTTALLPGSLTNYDGLSVVQPGSAYAAVVTLQSNSNPLTGVGLCDVIDTTTTDITTLDRVVNTNTAQSSAGSAYDLSGKNAYIVANSASFDAVADNATTWAYMKNMQENFTIEYGHVDVSGDNANLGTFPTGSTRYAGSWTEQARTANCANATGWAVTPDAVTEGANVIRAVAKPGFTLPAATNVALVVALEQRNDYNGGPHDGDVIPAGTVGADFAAVTSNEGWRNWSSQRGYDPNRPSTSSVDGDRVALSRASLRIQEETIALGGISNAVAAPGQSGATTDAGNQVVWKLTPQLTAESTTPADVRDTTVTMTLPAHVTYNALCTESLPGGTPAATVDVTGGVTTLTWTYPTLTPNQPVAPLIICADTNALAPNNTTVNSTAKVVSPDVATLAAQSTTHSIVLTQLGRLKLFKSVDQSLDLQDDEQKYTLTVQNFLAGETVAAPTVYDTMPYNGDASSAVGANRGPASDFSGQSELRGIPTAEYADGSPAAGVFSYFTGPNPADAPQSPAEDTDPGVWSSSPNAQTTAFKFVAANDLDAPGGQRSGLSVKFTTAQTGNVSGDLYANRFTASSSSFTDAVTGAVTPLLSNQTTVKVAGFTLGDLVWIDENADGVYQAGTDTTAPRGVTVEIYDDTNTLVGTTTTDARGRWMLNDIQQGDYYAVIPATEFATGGLLEKLAAAANAVTDANTGENETVDHHAIAGAGGSVRTAGTVSLTATRDADGNVVGNAPLGDNVAGLVFPRPTGDDFSNLTLDLALQRVPGYTFTKVASPVSETPVLPGGTITYTLTGTNTGSSDLAVTITDDLSEVLAYADITTPAAATRGTATVTGDTLSWNGTLTPGQSVTVTYTVTVKAGMEGETLRNSATSTATPPVGDPVPPITVETEHPVPGFSLGKSAVPASGTAVRPGEQVTYTITAANTGATELTNVVVNDDLAGVLEHAQLVAGSLTTTLDDGSTVTGAAVNGTTLSWTGTLPIGRTLTISYAVLVDADADANAATLHNRVTAEATPPGLPPITPPPAVTEHPVPGYTFTKISDPAAGDTVRAGDTITYTLTGTNTGATALDPVQVSDDLAAVLSYATLVDGSITSSLGAVPTLSGTDLTWSGALAVGEKIVITYAVTVNDGTEGVILHNLASSSATPPGLPPLVPPTVETQHPTPGFTFIKTADPATGTPVFAGETITYSLVARNSGKTVLDPVVISDKLAGVTPFADLVAGSLQATIDGTVVAHPTVKDGVLTWTGVLAEGETVTVTYQVLVREVAASADNIIRNHASASATPPGKPALTPPPVETAHPMPALALSKASNPGTGSIVRVGDDVAYTVALRNTGAADVNGVMLQDDLSGVLGGAELSTPVTVTIIAADGTKRDAGAVTRDGAVVSKLLSLAVGERAEMTYTVTVTKPNTKLRNVASIAWDGPPSEVPPSETEHIVPPNDPDVIDPPLVPEDPDTPEDPETPNTPDAPGTPEKPGKPSDPLAVTGAILPVGAAVVAGVLLLGGVLLMVRRRTRRSES